MVLVMLCVMLCCVLCYAVCCVMLYCYAVCCVMLYGYAMLYVMLCVLGLTERSATMSDKANHPVVGFVKKSFFAYIGGLVLVFAW